MNKILIIDLAFLVVFCVGIIFFLFKNKKNLKREGIIYLYRTKLGMNAIESFSKKYSGFLKKIRYLVIGVSFLLLVSIITLLATNAYAYIKSPLEVMEATNGAPPIAPLIPYFPQLFGMESFFPNFYFSYFLIALAIVAVAHEFAHGVFMKTFGVKIKSTGFLFLGPILGAFVEEDRNNLEKKKNSEQMTILGAGVFANTFLAIVFFILLILFFNLFYLPSGYIFSNYASVKINTSSIIGFQNYSTDLMVVNSHHGDFLITERSYDILMKNKSLLENHVLEVYLNYPAVKSGLAGAIVEVDGEKITDLKKFQTELDKKSPGDSVMFKTIFNEDEKIFNITLTEHPFNSSKAFLGIVNIQVPKGVSLRSLIFSVLFFKDTSTFYEARFNEDATDFFYYLIWWIALINLFVALFNMLPVGILDGGRFSYLLILSFVKSESKANKIYKFILSTVGLIFFLIVFGWLLARFF
jgi:membrane-associated protease RseP (regulator of RpoE activity)